MTYDWLERYFEGPQEDGILRPPMSGLAVVNIRRALKELGYNVEQGDYYDEELVKVVRQFQVDVNHSSRDGFVGPGTRKQLARALMDISERDIRGGGILHILLNPAKYSRPRMSDQQWEAYRKYFYNILTKSFNDEELRTLCFHMGIDYDNLPGKTRDRKAIELINYIGRHNRIYKLVAEGQ